MEAVWIALGQIGGLIFYPDLYVRWDARHEAEASASWVFKFIMNAASNGLRIGLALVFLGSFVFRPLVQSPVSRVWAGLIESKKPFFTMLLGGVGCVVVFVRALSR